MTSAATFLVERRDRTKSHANPNRRCRKCSSSGVARGVARAPDPPPPHMPPYRHLPKLLQLEGNEGFARDLPVLQGAPVHGFHCCAHRNIFGVLHQPLLNTKLGILMILLLAFELQVRALPRKTAWKLLCESRCCQQGRDRNRFSKVHGPPRGTLPSPRRPVVNSSRSSILSRIGSNRMGKVKSSFILGNLEYVA